MTAVDLPAGAHVVILNRWRDEYAHYRRYVDHTRCRVTYVTNQLGRSGVPAGAASVLVVDDLTDGSAVRAALAPVVDRLGRPSVIIALQESDLPLVCELREEYDAPGRRIADMPHFLDKQLMAETVTRLGIPAPRTLTVRHAHDIADWAEVVGWPVVVKPFRGLASRGVLRLNGPAALDGLPLSPEQPMLAQEYIPYPVYHADGYFDGRTITPWRLARYVNVPGAATTGPLAFTLGEPTGEVEIEDPARLAAAEQFLRTVIPALSADPWVFHLEMFMADDLTVPRCLFLEVGCRPGGGEIPFVWRENYGVDLMAIEVALQCGQVPAAPVIDEHAPIAGSLLVPLTGPRPCEILSAPSMVSAPDGPYAEALPAPGTVIPAIEGTYEHVGGRFRFRGASTAEVTQKIVETARTYRVQCRPAAVTVGG